MVASMLPCARNSWPRRSRVRKIASTLTCGDRARGRSVHCRSWCGSPAAVIIRYPVKASPRFGGVVYNGEQLVPEGIVFVSYNLRLGALGFLAHPALDANARKRFPAITAVSIRSRCCNGSNAISQRLGAIHHASFYLVRRRVAATSAALMTSPLTRGLIHGVAMQSSVPAGCEIQSLADAENGNRAARGEGPRLRGRARYYRLPCAARA